MSSRASCRSGRRPRSAAMQTVCPVGRRSAQIGRNRSPTPLQAAFSHAPATASQGTAQSCAQGDVRAADQGGRNTSTAGAEIGDNGTLLRTLRPCLHQHLGVRTRDRGRRVTRGTDSRKNTIRPRCTGEVPVSRCRTAASSASFPYRRSRSQAVPPAQQNTGK